MKATHCYFQINIWNTYQNIITVNEPKKPSHCSGKGDTFALILRRAINYTLRSPYYVCVIALPTRPSQYELCSSTNTRKIRIEIESWHETKFCVTIKEGRGHVERLQKNKIDIRCIFTLPAYCRILQILQKRTLFTCLIDIRLRFHTLSKR